MTGSLPTPGSDRLRSTDRLPWARLLVMAMAGFLLIAAETMPAGLLPQIAGGMNVSEGGAGQFVSAWALGTILFANPVVTLTRSLPRKPLLVIGLAMIVVTSVITAVSTNYILSLSTRFLAGVVAGLLWGILAGYARRITPPTRAGRALSIASLGVPVGLAFGTPLGAWLGMSQGWRWSFAAVTIFAGVTLVLAIVLVPNVEGQRAESRISFHGVVALPGVAPILLIIFLWMLSHNTMYTYFASYLRLGHTGVAIDLAFVLFGLSALVGIWITGRIIDRALRPLVLASITLFALAGVVLLIGFASPVAIIVAIVLWGIAFGGAAAQFQTGIGEAAGENADVANALLGTAWNTAIFGAGVLGAILISGGLSIALPALMVALPLFSLVLVLLTRHSFPRGR